MTFAMVNKVTDRPVEQRLRCKRVATCQRDRSFGRIGHQPLTVRDKKVMLVGLDRKCGHGARSVFSEDPFDVLFWCFEAISQNKRAQNEDEDVDPGYPARDLERQQEQRSITGLWNNAWTHDQDAGSKRFGDGSGILTPHELGIGGKKPRQSIKEHQQQQQWSYQQTFSQ